MSDLSWSETRNRLVGYVGATCVRHQEMYIKESPEAIAALARLRGGVKREPGEMPELFAYVEVDEATFGLQRGDAATQVEWAVYLALTMFATHQQSHRDRRMHVSGKGFGAAIAKLSDSSANPVAARRRFNAAATAIDITELAEHMYGLIGQLRQHAIPLDYGRMAADLFAWQTPDAAIGVRRAWGRDLQTALQRLHRKAEDNNEDAS